MKTFLSTLAVGLLALGSPSAVRAATAPTAETLVAEALHRNPQVRFYEAEIAVARGGRQTAGERHNPELSTEVGGMSLASQKDADLKHFEERVRKWPEVRECHMLSGEVDFILKCVAQDLSAFQTFVTETVTAERNVASVKSSLVIHPSKIEPGVPIEVPA